MLSRGAAARSPEGRHSKGSGVCDKSMQAWTRYTVWGTACRTGLHYSRKLLQWDVERGVRKDDLGRRRNQQGRILQSG